MDIEQHGDNMARNGGVGKVHWSNAMSSFVLRFFLDLVASGTKTSTGFKQVYLNNCAKPFYENLGVQRTGAQVGNRLRKWKRIYAKIEKLKNLSGANWDEQNCIIKLDAEHYKNHIQASNCYIYCNFNCCIIFFYLMSFCWPAHREDANYLNILIEHYHEMDTIFGNGLAIGAYAKGSNDPLATEVTEADTAPKATSIEPNEQFVGDNGTYSGNNVAEPSGTKPPPPKKHKTTTDDDLLVMISQSLGELSSSI